MVKYGTNWTRLELVYADDGITRVLRRYKVGYAPMARVEEGNATSSVGMTQEIGNRYGIQGDGRSTDTRMIYMILLVIVSGTAVGPTEVVMERVENRNEEVRVRFWLLRQQQNEADQDILRNTMDLLRDMERLLPSRLRMKAL